MLIIFAGCEVTDTPVGTPGRLTVQLTDAPGDFEAVFIDIESVQIKLKDVDEDADADSDNGEEFITISDQAHRVNLLELRNGNTIQLADEELESGEYIQIRLVLGSDNEVVINGESFPLKTPIAQQSGLKLNMDADIDDGETYNLLVDFDAGRSIVQTGNGGFILKPVLRVVALEETGSISGTVQPDSVQTSVMAIANNDTLSTVTETDGEFAIIGVPAGTYNVILNPNGESFADTTITGVNIGIDEDFKLGTVSLQQQ